MVRPSARQHTSSPQATEYTGVAGDFFLLDRKRELESPFEHHLKDDIHIGAVRLDNVKDELPGLGPIDARMVKRKHAETDVRQLLGTLVKFKLNVGVFNLALILSPARRMRSSPISQRDPNASFGSGSCTSIALS